MPEDVDWYGSPDAARWSTTGASPLPGSLLDRTEARLGLEARIIAEGYADLGPDTIGVAADWEVLVQELGRSGGPRPDRPRGRQNHGAGRARPGGCGQA